MRAAPFVTTLTTRGGLVQVFVLPLGRLTDEALNRTVTSPLTVFPILEFMQCVVRYVESKTVTRMSLRVAVHGFDAVTPLGLLGTTMLHRLVLIHGTVVRVSSPVAQCTHMAFRCSSCRVVLTVPAVDGVLRYPVLCPTKRCRGTLFVPSTDEASCSEVQLLRVQESAHPPLLAPPSERPSSRRTTALPVASVDASHDACHGMKVVDVQVHAEMMDSFAPGDTVMVCGILHALRGEKQGTAHRLCVAARGLMRLEDRPHVTDHDADEGTCCPNPSPPCVDAAPTNLIARCLRLRACGSMFECLVASLCPSIHGLDGAKAALVLSLLGGTPHAHTRNSIHVLLIGDPGLGKSQLLRAVSRVSPRGVYVCANTSSSCGLTISLTRNACGETSFEAGAVVHGDGGVTCIDELDKAPSEHKALLEVMEQRSVSLAKAGIVFSIPIHTTIVAAGNPIGGCFAESAATGAANGTASADNATQAMGNFSAALLSRFDFVFCLRGTDRVDRQLTHHVLTHHAAKRSGREGHASDQVMSVSDMMALLHYARGRTPRLTAEASERLKAAYLDARRQHATNALGRPLTARHLQGLIRASEARAKGDLAVAVEVEHVDAILRLMRECHLDDACAMDRHHLAGVRRHRGCHSLGERAPPRRCCISWRHGWTRSSGRWCMSVTCFACAKSVGARTPTPHCGS